MARPVGYALTDRAIRQLRADNRRLRHQVINLRHAAQAGARAETRRSVFKQGTLDGALSYNGTAVCSLYVGKPGAMTDSGKNITVYCSLLTAGESIAASSWVTVAVIHGYYEVIARSCPVT